MQIIAIVFLQFITHKFANLAKFFPPFCYIIYRRILAKFSKSEKINKKM